MVKIAIPKSIKPPNESIKKIDMKNYRQNRKDKIFARM